MRLPNAGAAIVEGQKITGYLLNPAHPDNGGKADFFLALGFSRENWRALADAFGEIARRATVTQQIDSPHGSKFIIDDYIDALGSRVAVRTVWIVDRGSECPRFVTAYPQQRPKT